jgi:beta-ketoacyl-acyl-carrier-protein synthase II
MGGKMLENILDRIRQVRPRVVITGFGALTPLGNTVRETWDGLLAGRSGVGPITHFDASDLPTRIAGEVKGFDPRKYLDFKEARRMSRASQLAVASATQAIEDAGFSDGFPDEERVSVLFGTGVGGLDMFERQLETLWKKGWHRVSPFGITSAITNMPAHHISQIFQIKGRISTITTACATGTQAVGEAAELIRRGVTDVVVTGGVEAVMTAMPIAGFSVMRALSTRNDEPERASRPFDRDRDGFVFSEGSATLVLESLEHAQARGAHIYAEVLGHSSSSDAYHVAAPDPEGKGAIRAMQWAIEDADLKPEDIQYINSHGPATILNDPTETLAIKTLFGEYAYNIPINSTKSMIGHSMGAAGAIEAMVCALSLEEGIIHPTVNHENPDPECDLDYVPEGARKQQIETAMSNSFGLGGQNACLVLGRYHPES